MPRATSAPVEIRMSEIDFHILGEDSDTARLKAACTLIEQAFLGGERVLVWLEDDGRTVGIRQPAVDLRRPGLRAA